MRKVILFVLEILTLLSFVSCAGGASGGNGAETSNLRLSVGTGTGRSANGRLSLFTDGSLSVDIKDSSGNLITSGSTDIVNGSGTVMIGGVTVGSEIIAEATVVTNGNTFFGTSSPTEVQEGTTNISVTVMATGTSLTVKNDVDYNSKLFEKLIDGQIYTLNVGNVGTYELNQIFSNISSKSSCRFNVVLGSDYNGETTFTTAYTCTNVISIDMTDAPITVIGTYAFEGWTGLTEVKVSSYTGVINNAAFKNCTSLTTLYTKNVYSIGECVFENVVTDPATGYPWGHPFSVISQKPAIGDIGWGSNLFGVIGDLLNFNGNCYAYDVGSGIFTTM